MKKIILTIGALGFSQYITAQDNVVTKYPEEIYQYSDNGQIDGTARFKGLSGAMGALGGDLSATNVNPAGTAVFLNNEFNISMDFNSSKIKNPDEKNFNHSSFGVSQGGGVFIFSDFENQNWKNISIGFNYQKTAKTNDNFDFKLNSIAKYDNNLAATKYSTNETGESSVSNVNIAANYQDKVYIGLGLNIHRFDINRTGDHLYETDNKDPNKNTLDYYKNNSKWYRNGSGASISLGAIARINKELRVGVSYQSPTWFSDIDEGFVYLDEKNKNYYWNYSSNNKTTPQKITASGAYVLGKKGLISVDYTYTDYNSAKFDAFSHPEDFDGVNRFINNHFKSTNSLRIGGEIRLKNLKLRGGYRYEQSPFDKIEIAGEKYIPFGDVKGFSLGAGYDFGGLYLDASYSLSKRDRSMLVSGEYYSFENNNIFKLITKEAGYEQVVNNFKENRGDLNFTLGFRF